MTKILDADKDWIDGMDAYAFLLERKGSLRELVSYVFSYMMIEIYIYALLG